MVLPGFEEFIEEDSVHSPCPLPVSRDQRTCGGGVRTACFGFGLRRCRCASRSGCKSLRGGGATSNFGADLVPVGSMVVQLPGVVYIVVHGLGSCLREGSDRRRMIAPVKW